MLGKVVKDNIIIGYYGDKAIVEDEYGDLSYFECPENLIPVGSVTDAELLDLELLGKEEKNRILQRFRMQET